MSGPATVIEALEATADRYSKLPAMRFKRQGVWRSVTWQDYRRQVERVAKGLISLGVDVGRSTVILSSNRPEWFVSHFGSIAAGALPVGLYTNSTSDQCRYIADHCEAAVAFVEDADHLQTFLELRPHLPRLEAIILMDGDPPDPSILSWSGLQELGRQIPETAYRQRTEALDPAGVCELIYTSGTTGTPKGVMLTHRNIVWLAGQVVPIWHIEPGDALISYLPLSHIAEQVVTLYNPIFTGACTWFAESLDKLGENLREVRPHIFFAVPRVWEKIQAVIETAGTQTPRWRRSIARWARRQGLAGGLAQQRGGSPPPLYGVADRLVFSKVRERLGLDRCRGAFTAAAPIGRQTLEFFLSLGIPILEVYGMSENTGPATISTPAAYRTGRAGRALEGTELKIAEDGEILMRGPHISPGYFKNQQASRGTFDDQGWLHSGDIGELDEEGYLSVTDRKKELIITSGGKNVAPQTIEKELRALPGVAQAVVVGDRRNYLTALLTLDPPSLATAAARIGSPARDLASAAACERFHRHLEALIEGVNSRLARFETIKRFAVLPVEFSVAGGELTPTLKLKRRIIQEKYADQIEQLYA